MKTSPKFTFALSLLAAVPLGAAEPLILPADESDRVQLVLRTPEELDELLGPIALYPDALIAVILPAATEPTDLVLAARYLDSGGSANRIDDQPWDESVRALAHYPDVVEWMDDNLKWTIQIGDAFLAQPADVMKSVQRLRAKARANGTLIDTPQHQVLLDAGAIRIVPADPEVIYVPRYDPQIVYVEHRSYYPDPFLTFGFGYAVGSWLRYDCDWHHRRLWVVSPHWNWYSRRDWCNDRFRGRFSFDYDSRWHVWSRPHRPHSWYSDRDRGRPDHHVVRPSPFVEDHRRPSHVVRNGDGDRGDRNNGGFRRPGSDRTDNGSRDRRSNDSRSGVNPGAATNPPPVVVNEAPTPPPSRVSNSWRERNEPRTYNNEIRRTRAVAPAPQPVASQPTPAPQVTPSPAPQPSSNRQNAGRNPEQGNRSGPRTWSSEIQRTRSNPAPAPSVAVRESAPPPPRVTRSSAPERNSPPPAPAVAQSRSSDSSRSSGSSSSNSGERRGRTWRDAVER